MKEDHLRLNKVIHQLTMEEYDKFGHLADPKSINI
jgi:hypothetical protein